MHHFSLTYTLKIGTGGLILFQKNAPNYMIGGADNSVNCSNVVQIPMKSPYARPVREGTIKQRDLLNSLIIWKW
jgi:hypothetical protein